MKQQDVTYVTGANMVNCVVPSGRGDAVLKAARDLGVGDGVVYQGRGVGLRERLGMIGIAVEAEKEVVSFIVDEERRDIIIAELFKVIELDSPAAGYLFATPVEKLAVYIPEEVYDQLKDS